MNRTQLWTFRTCSGLRNNEFWWWSWDHDDWGAQIGGPPKGTRWFTRFIKKNKKNAKRWVPEWLKFGPKRYRRYYARRKHLRGKIGWCLWRRTKKLGQEVDCTKNAPLLFTIILFFGCHFFCVHFHTSYVRLSIYTLGWLAGFQRSREGHLRVRRETSRGASHHKGSKVSAMFDLISC